MKTDLLTTYLNLKRITPFQWGICDCVLFVCDWCEVVTGVNPAKGAHGKYDTEMSAYKYLRDQYGNDPASHIDKHFKRITVEQSEVGDICICDLDGKETFGICAKNDLVLFKSDKILAKKIDKKIIWRLE